jgi:hypothetical protein
MSEKGKAWWRDPKFLIPGAIVPILIALIGLLSPFLTNRVSKKLSVTIEIDDSRRPDPSSLNVPIEKSYDIGSQEIKDISTDLAQAIEARIKINFPVKPVDRMPIDTLVERAEDGTLYIKGPLAQKVTLHFTRFPEYSDLFALLDHEHPNIVRQTNVPVLRLPEPATEVPLRVASIRDGVYRVVLTAPGYHDTFIYLEISRGGRLRIASYSIMPTEPTFPLSIRLIPRMGESGKMKIGIKHFEIFTSARSKPAINDIGKVIQGALKESLRERGFSTLAIKPDTNIGFHPNVSKNMPLPQGFILVDLSINGSVRWVD